MNERRKTSLIFRSTMSIALVVFCYSSICAQGGTGRETGNSNKPGTPTNKSSGSPSRPNKENRSSSASPSLEDTLKFIRDKVAAHNPLPQINGILPSFSFSPLGECKVQTEYEVFITDPPQPPSDTLDTFSLGDMNPQSLKITEGDFGWTISIFTTGRELKIWEKSASGSSKQSQGAVAVNDKEAATSIANALSHAIKLCGGKPDPF